MTAVVRFICAVFVTIAIAEEHSFAGASNGSAAERPTASRARENVTSDVLHDVPLGQWITAEVDLAYRDGGCTIMTADVTRRHVALFRPDVDEAELPERRLPRKPGCDQYPQWACDRTCVKDFMFRRTYDAALLRVIEQIKPSKERPHGGVRVLVGLYSEYDRDLRTLLQGNKRLGYYNPILCSPPGGGTLHHRGGPAGPCVYHDRRRD